MLLKTENGVIGMCSKWRVTLSSKSCSKLRCKSLEYWFLKSTKVIFRAK